VTVKPTDDMAKPEGVPPATAGSEIEFKRRVKYLLIGESVAWNGWTVARTEFSLDVWDAEGRKTRLGGAASFRLTVERAFALMFEGAVKERRKPLAGPCNVIGCDCPRKDGYALCEAHQHQYNQEYHRTRTTTLQFKKRSEQVSPYCKVPGCGQPKRPRSGFCREHFNASHRVGARRLEPA